ncbi:MAG TPA: hypothetical protein GX506_06770 [Firmicutes bacterium]|nr:hypothetical protein [Bacillota bacterium]
MPQLFLGIDIGTSSCKVAVYDTKGNLVVQASRPYGVHRPGPYMAEQDPEDWWEAASQSIREVLARGVVHPADIAGIGLSGQTPTQVFVDSTGKAVRPAIIWEDSRAQSEAEWIRQNIGTEKMKAFLGMYLPIEPTWPPARLLWVARHEPTTLERTRTVLQPKDFVGLRLTGVRFSDAWSSKGLVSVADGRISSDYLRLLCLPDHIVPDTYRPFEVVGSVRPEAAEATGLREGTPVVAGWSDALCGVLASGCFARPGIGFNVTGTSEIVGISCGDVSDTAGLVPVPGHLLGTAGALYGPTQSGGASLAWFKEGFMSIQSSGELEDTDVFRLIEKEAAMAPAGSCGLIFLPYLQGERAPIWDPDAKGAFVGITRSHRAAHFIRAVMEGVAYSVRHVLETAEHGSGLKAQEIRISGGASRNALWTQMRADVTGCPVRRLKVLETSTLGAAMLASVGARVYSNLQEATENMVHVEESIEPSDRMHEVYDQMFQVYKRLYPALKQAETGRPYSL